MNAAAATAVWLAVLIPVVAGSWLVATAADRAAARSSRMAAGGHESRAPRSLAAALTGLDKPLNQALAVLDREWHGRHERMEGAVTTQEAVLHALPDPLLLLDEGRAVVFANRGAEAAFGPGLAGRPLAAAIRAPPLLAAADRALEGPLSTRFEIGGEPPGCLVYAARLHPIEGFGADGTRIVLALRDVTRQERDERLRAEFVANASHEIRTPLTTLVGAIETLQGPARDDDAMRGEFLAMMQDHAARIGRLVDDLLSLSRIERSEHTAPSGAVAPGPVVSRAAEALAWQAKTRNVRIEIAVADALPPVVGDADELGLVFQNLIDNAIKYGNADATVRVEAAANAETVAVTVSDEGPGIPAEHLPRLTERFYRVDKARSNHLGGTGLGLAIVKHIVQRHRGRLDIDSTPGVGSRFGVRLKRAGASVADT